MMYVVVATVILAVATDLVLIANGSTPVLSRVDVRQGYVSTVVNVTPPTVYPQLLAVQPDTRTVFVTAVEHVNPEATAGSNLNTNQGQQLFGTLDVTSGAVSGISP